VGRYVLVSHDAGGTVPPMLALAAALRDRGHAVSWLGQPSIRGRAEAAGCAFASFTTFSDYARDRPLEEQVGPVVEAMAGRGPGDDALRVAADASADAVILDCNLAGVAAAVESSGLPSAVLLHSLYRTYVDVWFGELWPALAPLVNATRASYGLDACDSWTDLFERHDRIIAAVPEAFDALTPTTPPSLRHAGFLVPSGPDAALRRDGTPTVLVSLSTTDMGHTALLGSILDAVGGMDVRAVVTTAGVVDVATLDVPPNVEVHDHLPHHEVVPGVDAVVCHGGLGTVAVALAHGVPLVCTPIARDQPLNAERVAAVGAGLVVDAAAATHDAIRAALAAVLADPGYRAAARDIGAASIRAAAR
jgi:UDP:flavonoid glycosyltransferase YjiC (YdhE family)